MNTAAVITLGDELLWGEVAEANFPCLASALTAHGYRLGEHITLPDAVEPVVAALQRCCHSYALTLVTGGLGATQDDITRRAAAQAFERELVHHPQQQQALEAFYQRLHKPIPEQIARRGALLPAGAELVANPQGWACGFWLQGKTGGSCLFLPGVPTEAEAIVNQLPLPAPGSGASGWQRRTWRICGLGEAQVDAKLRDLSLPPEVHLSLGLETPCVLLHARCPQPSAAATLDAVATHLANHFGLDWVGEEASLAAAVARLCQQQQRTLALAESCTGGLISQQITALAGVSPFFLGSAVTYANAIKQAWLKVPEDVLMQHGAVSAPCAEAMVAGVLTNSGSDLALAVTGIAGPGGGSPEKPVGTVFISWGQKNQIPWVQQYQLSGDRRHIQQRTAGLALDGMRRLLISGTPY